VADDAALVGPPAESVADAIERMRLIGSVLPADDGLACFNRMYLTVTELVAAQIPAGFFADPIFIDRLDVVFANLYLGAVRDSVLHPGRAPRSWRALLERRSAPGVAAIQFALAGMNAHINHDLPIAVVETCKELKTSPDEGSHRRDFEKVNALLASAEESVRESFGSGFLLEIDRRIKIENVIGNWSIAAAREAAWTNALALWAMRRISMIRDEFLRSLDGMVGFAGRGLLVSLF
jgi:hypothetical protein